MQTKDFYKKIDDELTTLLNTHKDDDYLQKFKKDINTPKSYALLIWFLEFYGKIYRYNWHITDGHDDSSCDIVFDKLDHLGKKIFYVVQSKWNNEGNATKEVNRGEILKTISDFEAILANRNRKVNEKLQPKLKVLHDHIAANGKVKFIFLSLCEYKGVADDHIRTFLNKDPKISFEVIDINRIREDYIDRMYKKIDPINPLETYLDLAETPITLDIEKLGDQKGNVIKVERPFEAYIFLIRPKIIFELFEKYGFALFQKNVRNPLLQSQFNEEIEQTAVDSPAFFWYYNNGITAISSLLPEIGKRATRISDIYGFQVINGAQTVYAIYQAYKKATSVQRIKMDSEALISLRLLKSGGADFDLNVTRYTNSQNPINDRDFCANDPIQIRLQQESFKTNIWYEKRRGEFREVPDGIETVSNKDFANAYLAYELQEPMKMFDNLQLNSINPNQDLNYVSHKLDQLGRYELIFKEKVSFEDIRCSEIMYRAVLAFYHHVILISDRKNNDPILKEIPFCLGLSKTVADLYFNKKHESKKSSNQHVIKEYETGKTNIVIKIIVFSFFFFQACQDKQKEEKKESKARMSSAIYKNMKEQLERLTISPEDIEHIDVNSGAKIRANIRQQLNLPE